MIIYAIVDTTSYGDPSLALYDNREAATQHLTALIAESPQMAGAYQVEEREVLSQFTVDT